MSSAPPPALEARQYPLGRFVPPAAIGEADRNQWIAAVAALPAELRRATEGLTPGQWETAYREGGWTLRQVVHHLADSHMMAFARFKLALTQSEPTINAYDQAAWAASADAQAAPEVSLRLLEALHERWARLLRSLAPADWQRTFRHPERGLMTLEANLALYAWHGRHHTAQIAALREARSW